MTHDWSVAVDDAIVAAARSGAVFAFSLSGGKDSGAAGEAGQRFLDAVGHPRDRRVAIHADLGRAEWKATPEAVAGTARHLGLPLMVVRHRTHDMVSRWETRFTHGKRRYADLSVFNLIGPWSSSSLRFCTSEMKQQVIAPALQRAFPGETIVSVVGIRRDESVKRAGAQISKPESARDRADGSRMMTWHPVLNWSAQAVFARHAVTGLPLHEAYSVYGSSRVSCAFCVMQSVGDQAAAVRCASNIDLYRHLVAMEAGSSFSFQPARWLADVAPTLLSEGLASDVRRGKAMALQRRSLEAGLPEGLRYVKGWPLRAPNWAEAERVVAARGVILGHHGLPDLFPTPGSVIARFEQLMAERDEKASAQVVRTQAAIRRQWRAAA